MGYVPAHWEDAGWIPPQVGLKVNGGAYKEEDVWGVSLTPTGGGVV